MPEPIHLSVSGRNFALKPFIIKMYWAWAVSEKCYALKPESIHLSVSCTKAIYYQNALGLGCLRLREVLCTKARVNTLECLRERCTKAIYYQHALGCLRGVLCTKARVNTLECLRERCTKAIYYQNALGCLREVLCTKARANTLECLRELCTTAIYYQNALGCLREVSCIKARANTLECLGELCSRAKFSTLETFKRTEQMQKAWGIAARVPIQRSWP